MSTNTHIYPFLLYIITKYLRLFSIVSYYMILNLVPVLYNRSLFFIYFKYSSVYLLIPNS